MNDNKPGEHIMNTSEENKCQRCGALIPASSEDRLCPACLMSGAITPRNSGRETIHLTFGQANSRPEPKEFPFEFGGYRLLGLLGRGGGRQRCHDGRACYPLCACFDISDTTAEKSNRAQRAKRSCTDTWHQTKPKRASISSYSNRPAMDA